MRKIVLSMLVLAVLFSGGVYVISRKAPGLLRDAIQRAINKTVQIEAIEYRFPWTFELKGFRILETQETFANEECFAVGKVLLNVSPMSLSSKRLILDNVSLQDAVVVVRKRNGKLMHALSEAMNVGPGPAESAGGAVSAERPSQALPLVIHHFRLSKSRFQFLDYDVQDTGFVIALDRIEADLTNLALPPTSEKTYYRVDASLPQGRQQRAGSVQLNGWTVFANADTEALLKITELSLPYFKPYYSQVTGAEIEEGALSGRSAFRIQDRLLTADTDLELGGLFFQGYESGDELFGLKADEILSFLKDSAGRLQFHIALEWNLADEGVEKRAIIRRAIEQSLKKTLLGNVGNILEKTLQKFADSDTAADAPKTDWADALKKVKKLLR